MERGKVAVAAAALGALIAGAIYASGVLVTERAVAAPEETQATVKEVGPNQAKGPGYGPGYGQKGPRGGRGPNAGKAGCACCNKQTGTTAEQFASPADEAKKLAADYYTKVSGTKDFTVEVKDFGCHQEATILKAGKAVKLLSISGGEVREID